MELKQKSRYLSVDPDREEKEKKDEKSAKQQDESFTDGFYSSDSEPHYSDIELKMFPDSPGGHENMIMLN